MDRFEAMRVFSRVARLGSFAAAARELRLSTTAVSRHVSQLEEHLKTRLLLRSTRRLSLTAAGIAYLDRGERLLADLRELEDGLQSAQQVPRGRLRISAGVSFAQEQLNQVIPSFLSRFVELDVELILSDRHLDLVADNIDVAIRIGVLPDSSLHAKRLAPCRHVVCVSPGYLAQHGRILHPDELRDHQCIVDSNQVRGWSFVGENGTFTHLAQGRYIVNSAHAARAAVLADLGVAYLPTFVAGSHLASGELIPQLQDFRGTEVAVYAVYPENRYLSAGVRAFIEAMEAAFGDEPQWDNWMRQPVKNVP